MFAPLPFGVPLPISPENLFRLSKRNWMAGVVSVPEGLLSYYGEPVLDDIANKLLNELKVVNPNIMLEKTLAPRHYMFTLGGLNIWDSAVLPACLDSISDFAPLSVWDFCAYFDKHKELWGHEEMLEFLELIRDNAGAEVFARLCEFYSFPKFSLH